MLTTNGLGNSRNTALDGLRGIAILAVMLCHSSIIGPNQPESSFGTTLLALFDFGWAGVDLFFVLSGFLITQIILSSRNNAGWINSFFIKRAFRILPIYFLFISLLVIAGYTIKSQDGEFNFITDNQFYYWLMAQNFIALITNNWWPGLFYDGHLWSLAIEWQFYMVWPFIAGRLSHKALALFSCFVILVALITRIILWQLDTHIAIIYTHTITRMDSIAIGALIAIIVGSGINKTLPRKISNVLICNGIVFIAVTFYFYGRASYHVPLMYTVGYTIIATLFAGLILKAVTNNDDATFNRILSTRFLTMVGKYSYAMYIIHLPLMNTLGIYVKEFTSKNFYAQWIYLPTLFIATLLIAMVSWKIIEKPALSFAKNWVTIRRSKSS